jgi:hypothetical protein
MGRSKVGLPNKHLQSLLLWFLGDKDHQKVFEAVTRVEKSMGKLPSPRASSSYCSSMTPYRGHSGRGVAGLRCFHCNKLGHMWAKCMLRKSESQMPGFAAGPVSSKQPDKWQAIVFCMVLSTHLVMEYYYDFQMFVRYDLCTGMLYLSHIQ